MCNGSRSFSAMSKLVNRLIVMICVCSLVVMCFVLSRLPLCCNRTTSGSILLCMLSVLSVLNLSDYFTSSKVLLLLFILSDIV